MANPSDCICGTQEADGHVNKSSQGEKRPVDDYFKSPSMGKKEISILVEMNTHLGLTQKRELLGCE